MNMANISEKIKEWYALSCNGQKYYGIILTSEVYKQLELLFTDNLILHDNEQWLTSIYGLKILVYDELCNKYNTDCFCVDEPTYYQICEGKYYNDIGKRISEVLDKVEAKIRNEN